MSLCIALNKPNDCVIIFGDGRLMKGNELVCDTHKKLTMLTSHVSMFCSGVQSYCELLRERVSKKINEKTSIEEIADIIKIESRKVNEEFITVYPTFYDHNSSDVCLATVIGFYDVKNARSGILEYCYSHDNFEPRLNTNSCVTARGIKQEAAQEYLLSHFNPHHPYESILNTFDLICQEDVRVGGRIDAHFINASGIHVSSYGVKDHTCDVGVR